MFRFLRLFAITSVDLMHLILFRLTGFRISLSRNNRFCFLVDIIYLYMQKIGQSITFLLMG